MKKHTSILLLVVPFLLLGKAYAAVPPSPRPEVREEVRASWNKSSGLDCLYDMSPKASTPVPKGYQATYISHYGRHGSRYAHTDKAYLIPLEALRVGAASGNLTDRGFRLLQDLEKFWERNMYKVGDLTPLGWQQHRYIAETMVESFPKAFGKGSVVDACSSASVRSIISMTSACSTISRKAPKSSVYAHQSIMDIQATRPNLGKNPFRYSGPATPFPYPESGDELLLRKLPSYKDILGRLFKNPDVCLGSNTPFQFFFFYYMLVAGMNSLPEEERINIDGLLTTEEYALLWEVDNHERLREYIKYQTACSSIIDDIIAKADERLSSSTRGADLRFGHDHVVLSLLQIMDIDGFGRYPATADELPEWFQSFRSPMGANIQMVFYTSRCGKKREPLVKFLLNGEEVTLGKVRTDNWPYYTWEDARAWLKSRADSFVYR